MISKTVSRNLLVVALAAWMVSTLTYHKAMVNRGDDFLIFLSRGRKVANGQPLYDRHALDTGDFSNTYVYMPTIALLLQPFAEVPTLTMFKIWNVLMISAMISSCVMFCFAIGASPKADPVSFLICMLTIGHSHMTDMNFFAGQMNFLILLSITSIMYWLRQRNYAAVAICIALTAALKQWFLTSAIFLVMEKKWKHAFGSFGIFILIFLVEFRAIGYDQLSNFFYMNQNFSRLVLNTFTAQPSFVSAAKLLFTENSFSQPLLASNAAGQLFVAFSFSIVVAFNIWMARYSTQQSERKYALFSMSVLLMIPTTDPNYLIFFFPALWFLLVQPETSSNTQHESLYSPIIQVLACFIYIVGAWLGHFSNGANLLHHLMNFIWAVSLWTLCVTENLRAQSANCRMNAETH